MAKYDAQSCRLYRHPLDAAPGTTEMIPTSILALDLATNFGWARCAVGGQPESGAVKLPDTGRDIGRFLAVYDRWLVKTLREYEIDFVACEEPIGTRNLLVSMKLQNLVGHTEFVCNINNVTCRVVAISSWRKHFIGRGTSFKRLGLNPKEMAIAACVERGWNPATHDEAEALGILDYVFAKLELEKPWPGGGLFAGVEK